MKTRDDIINWLRDAYAMERGLEVTLEKQAENEDLDLDLRQHAAEHLQETRDHARAVADLLRALGSAEPTVKTGIGVTLEAVRSMGTMFSADERVKDLLMSIANEHFEIACYRALAAAGELAELPEVVETCDRIIVDEIRMADALEESLPQVVTSYLTADLSLKE